MLFTQPGLETAEKEWFSEAKGWICSLARAGATIRDDEIVGAHALKCSGQKRGCGSANEGH